MDIAEETGEPGYSQFSIGDGVSDSATKDTRQLVNEFQAVNLDEGNQEALTSTPEFKGLGLNRLSRQSSLNSINDGSYSIAVDSSFHPYQFQVLFLLKMYRKICKIFHLSL